MSTEYRLNNTGEEVQERLDKVFPNSEAISQEQQDRENRDDEMSAEIKETAKKVGEERQRAEQAENNLQDSIDAERQRATNAEKALQELIGSTEGGGTESIAGLQSQINDIKGGSEESIATLKNSIDTEKQRAEQAEGNLQGSIDTEQQRAEQAEGNLQGNIDEIEDLIPTQANKQNQLADKDFVNSSIATSTAEYRGEYDSLEELLPVQADDNDYAYVRQKDEVGNEYYDRYKYVKDTGWKFEFKVNNTTFTAAQWKSINSNITQEATDKLKDLPTANELNKDFSDVRKQISDIQGGSGDSIATLKDSISAEKKERESKDSEIEKNVSDTNNKVDELNNSLDGFVKGVETSEAIDYPNDPYLAMIEQKGNEYGKKLEDSAKLFQNILDEKQQAVGTPEIDAYPTEGSGKTVSSGGVYAAINDIKNSIPDDGIMYAGFKIGSYSSDAGLYNGTELNTQGIELIPLDERRVKVVSSFDGIPTANHFEGVYLKINKRVEELKGKWKLTYSYTGYNAFYLLPERTGWGVGGRIEYFGFLDKNGTIDLYELMQKVKAGDTAGTWSDNFDQGYFYMCLIRYVPASMGYSKIFEDIVSLDFYPENVNPKVVATEFSDDAKDIVKEIANEAVLDKLPDTSKPTETEKIQVTAWGDSLTLGSGSNIHRSQDKLVEALNKLGYSGIISSTEEITYPIMIQKLLGDKYNVTNCGVGGESIDTIAARLGANSVFARNPFTIPADTSDVSIGLITDGLDSAWGNDVKVLIQGTGNSVNPCYINGIECTIRNGSGNYWVKRNAAGNRSVEISTKIPIVFSGSKLYRNTKLAVIWCWQNGGYTDNEDLISKLDKIISHINTQNYIIIGLHTGTAATRDSQEKALASKYGDKFFNWREYVSTQALYDFGITPTKDTDITEVQKQNGVISDTAAMAEGSLPSSFWRTVYGLENNTSNDKTHLTATCYGILGFKIVEKFKELGYIK